VQLAFLNAAGNLLPGSPQFVNIPASASYVNYGENFTAPANASALLLAFNAVTGAVTGATAHLYVDDVSFAGAGGFAPADFNHDTKVDWLDLSVWRGAFGVGDGGNADGDGDTDGADLLIWQRSLASPAVGASGAAPEPRAGALGVLAMGLLVAKRRRV
jgi:MYXO-CTERM domain-containing protein